MKHKHLIVALIILTVLCVFTGAALAEEQDYSLYYNCADGKLYKDYSYSTLYTDQVGKWSGNGSNLTLEDGFAFSTNACYALVFQADSILTVHGTASIRSTFSCRQNGDEDVFGILTSGNDLTINGDGQLTVEAIQDYRGDPDMDYLHWTVGINTATYGKREIIYGDLHISDCTVVALSKGIRDDAITSSANPRDQEQWHSAGIVCKNLYASDATVTGKAEGSSTHGIICNATYIDNNEAIPQTGKLEIYDGSVVSGLTDPQKGGIGIWANITGWQGMSANPRIIGVGAWGIVSDVGGIELPNEYPSVKIDDAYDIDGYICPQSDDLGIYDTVFSVLFDTPCLNRAATHVLLCANENDYYALYFNGDGTLHKRFEYDGHLEPYTEQTDKWRCDGKKLILEDYFRFRTKNRRGLILEGDNLSLIVNGDVMIVNFNAYRQPHPYEAYGVGFLGSNPTLDGQGNLYVHSEDSLSSTCGIVSALGDGDNATTLTIRSLLVEANAKKAYGEDLREIGSVGLYCENLKIEDAIVVADSYNSNEDLLDLGVYCGTTTYDADDSSHTTRGRLTILGDGQLTGTGEDIGVDANLDLSSVTTGFVTGVGNIALQFDTNGLLLPNPPRVRVGQAFDAEGYVGSITGQSGARCGAIVTAPGGTAAARQALISRDVTPGALSIKTQPTHQAAALGASASFSVEAQGGQQPYAYQWQTFDQQTAQWKDIADDANRSGAKSNRLQLGCAQADLHDQQFRCVVTDSAAPRASVTSNAASLQVRVGTPDITGGGVFMKGQKLPLTITIGKDTPYFDARYFGSLLLDGKKIDQAIHTFDVTNGSIVISMKPIFLNTLSVGAHNVTVVLKGGAYAGIALSTSLSVIAPPPVTGDDTPLVALIGLTLLAGCGLIILLKRKKA